MSDFQITPSFRSKMTIPPNLQKQYEVAVRAGLQFMFDEGMREETLAHMDGPKVGAGEDWRECVVRGDAYRPGGEWHVPG